jgi:hypothetical protein
MPDEATLDIGLLLNGNLASILSDILIMAVSKKLDRFTKTKFLGLAFWYCHRKWE